MPKTDTPEFINRNELLEDLNLVRSGLSNREFLEQSSCLIFRDGVVATFNEEISCRRETKFPFEGAVSAQQLISMLDNIHEEQLEVRVDGAEFVFKGHKKEYRILRDAEITLPVEKVAEEIPDAWHTLPHNFTEIISTVKHCVGTEDGQFALTCIHLHPEKVEACDNRQAIRWYTQLALEAPVLVRGDAISHVVGLGVTQFSESASWIHFKRDFQKKKKGEAAEEHRDDRQLIFSCRKFVEDFNNLDQALEFKGQRLKIPKGLAEAGHRASIAAVEEAVLKPTISLTLKANKILVVGKGMISRYKEIIDTKYSGPEIKFVVSPDLLKQIVSTYDSAEVGPKRLKATGGTEGNGWEYVTLLGAPAKPAPLPEPEPEAETQEA